MTGRIYSTPGRRRRAAVGVARILTAGALWKLKEGVSETKAGGRVCVAHPKIPNTRKMKGRELKRKKGHPFFLRDAHGI